MRLLKIYFGAFAPLILQNMSIDKNFSMAASDITLLLPQDDTENPELSIVIPALNEEITVGQFVDWCKQGIAAAGISAEILIIDSSTDRTAEIALSRGARVLKTP